MPFLFALTLGLSAVLLFSVQPMLAKEVLPQLGGAPAVWTTCMVFFQTALLAGYLYAHALTGWLSVRRQTAVHAVLLLTAIVLLPLGRIELVPSAVSTVRTTPTVDLLLGLLRSAGVPLLAVAATAPLLQRWFAATDHTSAADPYFLYGASNFGSLAALLAYPLAIEPNLSLVRQRHLWAAGMVGLAMLTAVCAWLAGRRSDPPRPTAESSDPPLEAARRLRWVFLAFVPSSLMLGVTTYISTDVAPVPLLWVIPLAVYLLSFILTFARRSVLPHDGIVRIFPLTAMALTFVLGLGLVQVWWLPLHLLTVFAAAMVCHGELARDRPPPRQLTTFYLAIALGGVLGGIFNALVAPVLFDRVAEYPLALVLACLASPAVQPNPRRRRQPPSAQRSPARRRAADVLYALLVFGLTAAAIRWSRSPAGPLAALAASGLAALGCWTHRVRPVRFALTLAALLAASGLTAGRNGVVLHQERNFFGVLQVTYDPDSRSRRLFHGRTLHGQQSLDPALRDEPGSYFSPRGPIGQVFDSTARPASPPHNVAVVGLGVGSLACYAQPNESWTFYELDPAVVRIASDPAWFTYLRDCRARSLAVELGDARLKLADAPDHHYDRIIIDAFSADAIPVHLLTREALQVYRRKLTAQGMIAFHISNRAIELESVVAALARDAGMWCRIRADRRLTPEDARVGKQPSIWAVLAPPAAPLGPLATDPRWRPPSPRRRSAVWTDDFSALASHLILAPR